MKTAGIAHATCWQVVDCGLQTWQFPDTPPRRIRELLLSFEFWDDDKRPPFSLERRYNWSFWRTSCLTLHLQSWLGRPLTAEEREGAFDFRQLVGMDVTLDVSTNATGFKRIEGLRPGLGRRPPHRVKTYLMLQDFDPLAWDLLSFRLRDRIIASPTYAAMFEPPEEFPADYIRPATTAEILDGDEVPW